MLSTRHMSRAIAVALLALAMSPLLAQTLHRCGNTFSQTPCGEGTTSALRAGSGPVAATAAPNASGVAVAPGAKVCADAAVGQLGLPPGFSSVVRSAKRGPAEAIKFANDTLVTRTWDVTVGVHNGAGTPVDVQSVRCNLSEDEQRVLKLTAAAK
jgi:hypothetical protein